jgi:hypothetical protein
MSSGVFFLLKWLAFDAVYFFYHSEGFGAEKKKQFAPGAILHETLRKKNKNHMEGFARKPKSMPLKPFPTKQTFTFKSKDVHSPFSLNSNELSYKGQHIGSVTKKEKISNAQGTNYTVEFSVPVKYDEITNRITYNSEFIAHRLEGTTVFEQYDWESEVQTMQQFGRQTSKDEVRTHEDIYPTRKVSEKTKDHVLPQDKTPSQINNKLLLETITMKLNEFNSDQLLKTLHFVLTIGSETKK